MTGHWIEETSPGDWQLKSALLGFTQMNSAHNGVRLGRALYKIISRVGIRHKVRVLCSLLSLHCSHVYQLEGRLDYMRQRGKQQHYAHQLCPPPQHVISANLDEDVEQGRQTYSVSPSISTLSIPLLNIITSCLAHVINLATQAVINTYSKSKHYDPANPDAHIPDTNAKVRDEIALVRSITVKVCTSL